MIQALIARGASDVLELLEGTSVVGVINKRIKPYKLKPIHITMRPDELVDVPNPYPL